MLFYTTLLVTSLILTLVILWLYKLIVIITRKVFKGRLSNEKPVSMGLPGQINPGRNTKTESQVWGTYGHSNPSTMARTHPAGPTPDQATPWGWPDHDHMNDEYRPMPASSKAGSLNSYLSRNLVNAQTVGTGKQNVDLPDRDDRSAFIGKAYKEVRREARKAASKDLHHTVDDKPWGW